MTTLTLSNRDITTTIQALRDLDGTKTSVTDADGKVHVVTKPYAINGKTRYAIGRCIKGLTALAEATSDAHNAIVKSLADPKNPVKVLPENQAKYTEQVNDLMKTEVDIAQAVHLFPIAELGIDTNQIPGSVVAGLLPVVTGEL